MRLGAICTLCGVLLMGGTGHASAVDSDDAFMQGVRMGLSAYDFEPDGTIGIVRDLTALVGRADVAGGNLGAEARFLRAAVAADLYFAAVYEDEPERFVLLAEAFGAPVEGLSVAIAEAVDSAAVGLYRGASERARGVLAAAKGGQLQAPSALAELRGAARDAALLRGVSAALAQGAEPAVLLATVGRDRCGGVGRGCTDLHMMYDAASRRALDALSDLGQAATRVRTSAEGGDPLSALVLDAVQADYEQVRGLSLSLTPLLDDDLFPFAEGTRAVRAAPDLLVSVTAEGVRYGFVPTVSLDEAGALRASAQGEPVLPKMATVELPGKFRPYMRPLSAVVSALSPAFEAQPGLRVGVTSTGGMDAHVLGRTLLSLRVAGCEHAELVGRDEHGAAMGVPLEVIAGPEVDKLRPLPTVRLRVRLGGYSLGLPGGTQDIPRVREPTGFRFDTGTLEGQMARRGKATASVSFMADVQSQNLLAAMWRVAPEQRALKVLIP